MTTAPRRFTAVPAGLLALLLAGCNDSAKPRPAAPAAAAAPPAPTVQPAEPEHDPREVVAKVDDVALTWEAMEHRAKGLYLDESRTTLIPAGREREAMEFFRRRAVTIFVFKTIMLEEAARQKIVVTEADRIDGTNRLARSLARRQSPLTVERFFRESTFGEQEARREFEDGVVIDKLLKLNVQDRITVTNSELDALAGEIIADRTEKRRKAESLRAQLLAGADFAKLAAEHSDDASKRTGGDLGQIARGRMVKPFDEAVFSQPVGEVGPLVETKFGFHIIKVTARHPAQAAGADAPAVPETAQASHILVKAQPVLTRRELIDELRRRKYDQALREYYAGLKRGRRITCIYKDLVL